GYRCHIFAPEPNSGAAEVSAAFTCAPWSDSDALGAFGAACDVVTLEFENVPVGPLASIEAGKLAPPARALEVAQDRLKEKTFVEAIGGRPAVFAPVETPADLLAAVERSGARATLKTRREGYGGKGQWRIKSLRDAEALYLPQSGRIFEGLVRFSAELS